VLFAPLLTVGLFSPSLGVWFCSVPFDATAFTKKMGESSCNIPNAIDATTTARMVEWLLRQKELAGVQA